MLEYKQFILRIIICFLLSACIGVERQYRRRLVGLRTIILVSIGSFLFVTFSFAFPESDITRIAAQVVAGIGFLGAGVIIKDGKSVKGLTTAATLWCSAAIGILCSGGFLFEAAVGTLIILFTNITLRSVNAKINSWSGNTEYDLYFLSITCKEDSENEIIKIIKTLTKDNNSEIKRIESNEIENGTIKLDVVLIVEASNKKLSETIMQKLSSNENITTISLDKKNSKFLLDNEEL